MATDGPMRSGSAAGFPVPSSTIWVRGLGAVAGVGVCAQTGAGSKDDSSIVKNAPATANGKNLCSLFIRLLRFKEQRQDAFVFLDPRN